MPSVAPSHLFDRHHLAIYRFVLRATGDAPTAEDLTQEVFLRVLRTRPDLDGDADSRAWLFRVARNLLIDRARRAGRRPRARPLEAVAAAPGATTGGLRLELSQALEALSAEDREVFLMSQVGGLSYREVAASAGLSEAAVRSRIFRARCRLRQALASCPAPAEEGDEP